MLVPRLSRLLITLPLVVLPMTGLSLKPALASGVAAEEAVRILSKARTADSRCNFLSSSERSELSRFTARAEIAAASQVSSRAARAAAATGASEGQAGSCSPDLKADVQETLGAAREAMAAAAPAERHAAAAPPARSKPSLEAAGKSRPVTGKGLNRYAQVIKAYYLERECRSLTRSQDSAFWKGVVNLHKSVVASHGAKAVAPVMRNAEKQASGSSCGAQAQATIRSGYDEITSR